MAKCTHRPVPSVEIHCHFLDVLVPRMNKCPYAIRLDNSNSGPIPIPFSRHLKKPNVNSSREQPLTTVTFQDPPDETHCPILPLSVDQIWQLRLLQKVDRPCTVLQDT